MVVIILIGTRLILCDGKGKMDLQYITIFKTQMPAIVINNFAIKVQTMSFSNFKKKKRVHIFFSPSGTQLVVQSLCQIA